MKAGGLAAAYKMNDLQASSRGKLRRNPFRASDDVAVKLYRYAVGSEVELGKQGGYRGPGAYPAGRSVDPNLH